jgi:uncharacterized protein
VVDSLKFNVAQLLKEPVGTARHTAVSAALWSLAPELEQTAGTDEASEAMLDGPVRMMHTNAGILVQGSLRAQTTLACARCLEPVAMTLAVELEEVYSPTIDILTGKGIVPEDEDRALWIDEHHILDLTEVLRQDVLIAMPLHVLCKEDCRGLCPTCGQNLNEGPCGCEPEADARWGPLVALLQQTKEE